jgi:uncharacterized protein (TIGR03034 family)
MGSGPKPANKPKVDSSKDVKVKKKFKPFLLAESKHKPKVADVNQFLIDGNNLAADMRFLDFTKADFLALNSKCKDHKDLLEKSPSKLFEIFRSMCTFYFATGDLEKNINDMIDKFQGNTGGEYSNPILTEKVKEHERTVGFCNHIKDEFKKQLNETDIINKKIIELKWSKRPIFGSLSDKKNGLTIAINDIWAYTVYLNKYESTGSNSYKAEVHITIFDHFGLDKNDIGIEKPASRFEGFFAWFILQHVYGYEPFVTKIEFDYLFEGSF